MLSDLFQALVAKAQRHTPLVTAVVHPVTVEAFEGFRAAEQQGLIKPILVGPVGKIEAVAEQLQVDLTAYELIATEHSHGAVEQAVALARAGQVEMMMKGALHTDELMSAVVEAKRGLRTERRMSHVFVAAVPHYPKLLLLTDCALNIAPDLSIKRDIIQNAIDLAHALAIEKPKVAILSAIETINEKLPSTLQAAALCKMAERGQIEGGILDGPLAFDNAISKRAADIKQIVSPVAGEADILVLPDLEAGNLLAKQLQYFADAQLAGIVLGAKVPIVLTSRADSAQARWISCALSVLLRQRLLL